MHTLLERCRGIGDSPSPSMAAMKAAVSGSVDASELDSLLVDDPSRPYGRKVLMEGPHMEMMIASWTRGRVCAPHDHGGSVGAVRVLRGEAIHRVWKLVEGRLELAVEERVGAGAVLACGPDMVHSMGDAGAAEKLATLHIYRDPIPFMVVYDPTASRTLQVAATCGAWIPGPEQILREVPGLHRRAFVA